MEHRPIHPKYESGLPNRLRTVLKGGLGAVSKISLRREIVWGKGIFSFCVVTNVRPPSIIASLPGMDATSNHKGQPTHGCLRNCPTARIWWQETTDEQVGKQAHEWRRLNESMLSPHLPPAIWSCYWLLARYKSNLWCIVQYTVILSALPVLLAELLEFLVIDSYVNHVGRMKPLSLGENAKLASTIDVDVDKASGELPTALCTQTTYNNCHQ